MIHEGFWRSQAGAGAAAALPQLMRKQARALQAFWTALVSPSAYSAG